MVFVGVIGGIFAFGPVGLLVGPLILALVIALIRFTLEVRSPETEQPVATTPNKTKK
jgi:predicted PurR-regulated permease PerM